MKFKKRQSTVSRRSAAEYPHVTIIEMTSPTRRADTAQSVKLVSEGASERLADLLSSQDVEQTSNPSREEGPRKVFKAADPVQV